jgi:hypothetical protein
MTVSLLTKTETYTWSHAGPLFPFRADSNSSSKTRPPPYGNLGSPR